MEMLKKIQHSNSAYLSNATVDVDIWNMLTSTVVDVTSTTVDVNMFQM